MARSPILPVREGRHVGAMDRARIERMRFSREHLDACRDRTVDDLAEPGLRLLFVGINPGLWSAATGVHFGRPGNRFYAALWHAGITDRVIDASAGMTDGDRDHLIAHGVGITNIVARATARADELSRAELETGSLRLHDFVLAHQPKVVAIAGITAYRKAYRLPHAQFGEQPEPLAGASLWVVPNPSGLNAHETAQTLGAAYREPALAAGVVARAEVPRPGGADR